MNAYRIEMKVAEMSKFSVHCSCPENTQRNNNVASTSLRRHDVEATSKQRYNNVVC